MSVSARVVLDLTDAKKIAVGASNITSLEGIQTVLGVAEELGQPIILQFAPVHESTIPFKVIGPVMVMVAERSSVPVCAHLDHGGKLETLREALKTGFILVMYGGPVLSFEEDAANIRIAVEMAGDWGASAEAEIGAVGRQGFSDVEEDEEGKVVESYYMGPEQAQAFTGLTGIDALAYSFGIVHGLYLTTSKLNLDRIHRIRESIGIPIVMYDGSRVSDEGFKKCVANRIREINYYTYLAKMGGMYVKERCRAVEEYTSLYDVTQWVIQVMGEDVLHTIRVLSHLEQVDKGGKTMKRLEINRALRDTEKMIDRRSFKLPPFCHFTPEEWNEKGHEYGEVRGNILGRDITDLGTEGFDKVGSSLIALRNSNVSMDKYTEPYAEKLLYTKEGQSAAMYFHWNKMEDIINRGGGNVLIGAYNIGREEPADIDVWIHSDGREYTVPAGVQIQLCPGESITTQSYLYHDFHLESDTGPVLLGEISMCNDDNRDNWFHLPVDRLLVVEEDEPPFRLLYNEYPPTGSCVRR